MATATPAMQAEMNAQFESDKRAFDGLDARGQNIAGMIATGAFRARQGIVKTVGFGIDISEKAFNIVIRAPLAFVWDRTTKLAANTASAPVRIATAIGRGALGVEKAALGLASKAVLLANHAGLLSDESREDKLATLSVKSRAIEERREKIAQWGRDREKKAGKDWKQKKHRFRQAMKRTGEFLEYHGAIGLYRAFKWMLDPRRPDGKPVIGNEKLNRALGFVAAAAMFGVLSFQLTKIAVIGKILHIQLAHSLVTSTSSFWLKMVQQTVLHPAITVGLTALKFVTLPVIAAARGRLKSTEFTQGVAYSYNKQLREYRESKLQSQFRRAAAAPDENDTKWKQYKYKAVEATRKESLGFLRSFFRHIIEKSSPEFYEVRLRHYRQIRADRKLKKQEKKGAQVEAVQPSPVFAPDAPKLAAQFGNAQNPPVTPPLPDARNQPKPPVP